MNKLQQRILARKDPPKKWPQWVKTMIDGEGEGGDVLSDDRIVEVLKEAGVDIARRTVAKYREALRIPSSVQRRRMLKAG